MEKVDVNLDPRIDGGEFQEEVSSERAKKIGKIFATMTREILVANEFDVVGLDGVDLGAGNGNILDMYKSEGFSMLGVDARPRRGDIVSSRIEDMNFLPRNSVSFATSCLLFDRGVYEQNIAEMQAEIARILRPNGMYIGFEFHEDLPDVPGCIKQVIPKITFDKPEVLRAQVFKKTTDGKIVIPEGMLYDRRNIIGNRAVFA